MPIIAYLANQFPSPLEPYVADEIIELRRRGVIVIPCSARSAAYAGKLETPNSVMEENETLYLAPLRFRLLLRSLGMCIRHATLLADLYRRILFRGAEPIPRRLRALLHTWLGAYYALLLEGRGVQHVHAHHGYFSSWIAMVASRFLGAGFSFTLHGSDLLLDPLWLDVKLHNCDFCVTVSEFNRQHIVKNYPEVGAEKICVQRLGVNTQIGASAPRKKNRTFTLLAVGRLHPVKNHVFLLRACAELLARGVPVCCWIAGEGLERSRLQQLIFDLHLSGCVHLLGHLSPAQLKVCYRSADLAVLTSHSEGIPVVLMQAMALGTPVLAPALTGVPELVQDEMTGLLYQAGNMHDFIRQVERIHNGTIDLQPIITAARHHVAVEFDCDKNLRQFSDMFLHQLNACHATLDDETTSHAHTLLQQI
jgi:colanic acid/amylovoran biosynthesis glycosyltransferase